MTQAGTPGDVLRAVTRKKTKRVSDQAEKKNRDTLDPLRARKKNSHS